MQGEACKDKMYAAKTSVAELERFDADPDPTFHADADPIFLARKREFFLFFSTIVF